MIAGSKAVKLIDTANSYTTSILTFSSSTIITQISTSSKIFFAESFANSNSGVSLGLISYTGDAVEWSYAVDHSFTANLVARVAVDA